MVETKVTIDNDRLTVDIRLDNHVFCLQFDPTEHQDKIADLVFNHIMTNLSSEQLNLIKTSIYLNNLISDSIRYRIFNGKQFGL